MSKDDSLRTTLLDLNIARSYTELEILNEVAREPFY